MTAQSDNDRTRIEAAERAAREAAAEAAAERNAREAAERAARETAALVVAERELRLAAEKAAGEANAKAANERTARESAEKAAREAAAKAANERAAREEAEEALRHAAATIVVEHAARESAERVAQEAVAKASAVGPSEPGKPVAAARSVPAPPVASSPPSAQNSSTSERTNRAPGWLVPTVIFAVAGALFWLISGQWTNVESGWFVRTDDAFVRADAAPLSTKVVGTVQQIHVKDFERVKSGQVLVELKNDDYKAQVEQAQAAVSEAQSKLADMRQRKEQQDARVLDSLSVLDASRATVQQATDGIAASQASIDEAKAGIDAAKAALTQSQAAIKGASADATRASLERARQEGLLTDESTTREKVELAENESDRANANLEAQKASQTRAQAELAARCAQLNRARQQLSTSRAEREKSLAAVKSRQAELTAQKLQRKLVDGQEEQLKANLASKKAALQSAQVNFEYTIIRAPQDGVVGELKVKPGQLVSAGTQVTTIISSTPWVIGNYRETQLVKVKPGDKVDIDVDAVPGAHFKGHVEAIAPASGAQFSVLPADNASGNFTKVTQRIPVKIVFDEDAQKLSPLRPGMSAIATIKPGSAK